LLRFKVRCARLRRAQPCEPTAPRENRRRCIHGYVRSKQLLLQRAHAAGGPRPPTSKVGGYLRRPGLHVTRADTCAKSRHMFDEHTWLAYVKSRRTYSRLPSVQRQAHVFRMLLCFITNLNRATFQLCNLYQPTTPHCHNQQHNHSPTSLTTTHHHGRNRKTQPCGETAATALDRSRTRRHP
jgi:hypothetical protein